MGRWTPSTRELAVAASGGTRVGNCPAAAVGCCARAMVARDGSQGSLRALGAEESVAVGVRGMGCRNLEWSFFNEPGGSPACGAEAPPHIGSLCYVRWKERRGKRGHATSLSEIE